MNIQELHQLFLKSTGVCIDSRKIKGGELFFALKGPNYNANLFAAQALIQGALYAVVDEIFEEDNRLILVDDALNILQQLSNWHRNQFPIPVIAITGTNGKTTNKELIKAVLSKKFKVLATEGNFNNHIGVPLTLLNLNRNHEMAIIEMGANHQGEINELCEIANPTHGLITSIGIAHLEGFGSVEVIKQTKCELYNYLEQKNGFCFINNCAIEVDELPLKKLSNTFCFGYKTSYLYFEITKTVDFLNIIIFKNNLQYKVHSKLIGVFQANNLLNAFAIGDYFKIPSAEIIDALEGYCPQNNRAQLVELNGNKIVLDAYNANPTSMSVALQSFEKSATSNKMVVLGDMLELGKDSLRYHQEIVHLILEFGIEKVVLIGVEFLKTETPVSFLKFETTSQAKDWWNKNEFMNWNILVKGSRGNGLERIFLDPQ